MLPKFPSILVDFLSIICNLPLLTTVAIGVGFRCKGISRSMEPSQPRSGQPPSSKSSKSPASASMEASGAHTKAAAAFITKCAGGNCEKFVYFMGNKKNLCKICEITAKIQKGKENANTKKSGPGPSKPLWNKAKPRGRSDKAATPVYEDDKRLEPKQPHSPKRSLSLSREGETRVPRGMVSSLSPSNRGKIGSATPGRNTPYTCQTSSRHGAIFSGDDDDDDDDDDPYM